MNTLRSKILVALVISVLMALALVMLMTRINLQRGTIELIERQEARQLEILIPELGELYQQNGSWDFLRHSPRRWNHLLRMTRPSNMAGFAADQPHDEERRALAQAMMRRSPREEGSLRSRLFLLDANKAWVAGAPFFADEALPMEVIEAGGEQVGWLGFIPVRAALPPEAHLFVRGQARALLVSLLMALTLAAGLGFLLARHLSRPLRQLAEAVDSLSSGDYSVRAQITSRDEIGRLGRNVNQLAETLEKNRGARRRWMADIAHELRTPVSVLRGEIEALQDGLRKADDKALDSLREEAEQLSRLVNDLQTLALSDAGALDFQMEDLDLSELLEQVARTFQGRLSERDIKLTTKIPEGVRVSGDSQRLRQLLQNLLENSCRYVQPGGQVDLVLDQGESGIVIGLDDSGPGVPPEQRSRLFDRFYRVEGSRSRSGGGSGLGLAICRNIAEAHQGRISAKVSRLGGLRIQLDLPA